MKFFSAILLMGIVSSSVVHAAQVSCNGEYMGFRFSINGKSSNGKIIGNVRYRVSNGSDVNRNGTLQVTSSEIRAQQYMHFTGHSPEVSGRLDATFESPSGLYKGILAATADVGSADVDVVCGIKGPWTQQVSIDAEDIMEWLNWES